MVINFHMSSTLNLYHRVPEEFGDRRRKLYPSHEIVHDLVSNAVGSIDDERREIDLLGCAWPRAIHLFAVEPSTLRDLMRRAGHPEGNQTCKWFVIPAKVFDRESLVVHLYDERIEELRFESRADVEKLSGFEYFRPDRADVYRRVPHLTEIHYTSAAQAPDMVELYPFCFLPRVLHKGSIDTTLLDVIEA